MSFTYTVQKLGTTEATVGLHGEFDLRHASEVRVVLSRLIEEGRRHLLVDLSGLDYIDSAGLGVLLSALAELRRHRGDLRIRTDNPKITRIFEVTKLSHLFSMDCDDTADEEEEDVQATGAR